MISKGTPHNNGPKLARYMTTGKKGERAELWELFGFASDDITDAFRDVHVMAEATRCQQPFFHVQVRNPAGEGMPREHWKRAADRIESILGLKGQPRAISFHMDEKTGDEHMHVAWSRIDEDTLKAKPLPFYKLRLKRVSRELEAELGLTVVANQREGPIDYAPKRAEDEQARRLGVNIHDTRNAIRDCYDRSDCGRSFDDALAQEGLILAQGERRDYVVIDPAGGMHALGKRILGVPASEIRDKLADLDRQHLPTVEQARELMLDLPHDRLDRLNCELAEVEKLLAAEREYARRDPVREEMAWLDAVANAAIEKEKIEGRFIAPEDREKFGAGVGRREEEQGVQQEQGAAMPAKPVELKGAAAQIRNAWERSDDARAFVSALDEKGIALAEVNRDEAQRSHRSASFATEVGNFAPRYQEGEIVAVTTPGQVYPLNRRTTGKEREDIEAFLAPLDRARLQSIEATKETLQQRLNEKQWPTAPAEREKKVLMFGLTLKPAPATSSELHFQDAAREAARPEEAPSMPSNLKGAAADIWAAYNTHIWEREKEDGSGEKVALKGGRDPFRFAEAIEEKGMALARVTKGEAERSPKETGRQTTHGQQAPRYREGEFVAITEAGDVYSLNRRTTGQDSKRVQSFLARADWRGIYGIDATKQVMQGRAEEREAYWRNIRAEIAASRLERAGDLKDRARKSGSAKPGGVRPGRVVGELLNDAIKPLDMIFSLIDPPKSSAQLRKEAIKARIEREAQADLQIDFSKYTGERAQERRNEQEQQAAKDRQRESERER